MAASDEPEPTFEEALGQLEKIVSVLERGDTPLSDALAQYEHGVRLLARCHRLLDTAEQTVAVLTGVDEAGNAQTAPFDATATAERERPAPAAKRSRRKAAASEAEDDAVDAPF
jgi:exodeoxyribonuclease VII small subunit